MPARYLNDEELISACIQRNKEAWDVFVERYSKLVYWSIFKTLTGSDLSARADVVEDIFQDFFQKILSDAALLKLESVRNLKGFITVTVCHLTLDKIKFIHRKEFKSTPAETDLLPDSDEPSSLLISKEEAALLDEAMETLSEKEKFCLELHYQENCTQREIGQLLGVPQDTVSTILRRSKDKMRKALEKKGLSG